MPGCITRCRDCSTPNTGAHLTEGASEFIVPAGSADAITGRLETLATNRTLLRDMSHHASQQSQALSLQAYGRRPNAALTTLAG